MNEWNSIRVILWAPDKWKFVGIYDIHRPTVPRVTLENLMENIIANQGPGIDRLRVLSDR